MDYFRFSQQMKAEIESNPIMVQNLRESFNGTTEPFSFGETVNLYRIGKLNSGLYVALRAPRTDADERKQRPGGQIRDMEIYCQNAEQLASEGEEVPKFCVGTVYETVYENLAGIITEDLTAGGQYEFEDDPEAAYGFVNDGKTRRRVFMDIDAAFRLIRNLEMKYFSDGAVLRL